MLSEKSFQVTFWGDNSITNTIETTKPKKVYDNKQDNGKKVFVIHGHNEAKWRELQAILRDLKVEPVVLSEQILNGKTIIENIEEFANKSQFAIAIFTYDDIVYKNDKNKYLQVRPNVIFELGWFYAHLGRQKVMIIEQINDKGNVFSDLYGIYIYRFHENVKELYLDIRKVLEKENII